MQTPSFGMLLRQFRRRAGLTQVALAARSGVTESAISALERGARERPYPDTLDRLATALGLSVAERDALAQAAPATDLDREGAASSQPAAAADRAASPPSHSAVIGLPASLTSFVGRERELAAAAGLLAERRRLLTLTGPGGTGKTRLAIESARAVAHNFLGGVWFVDLAPLALGGAIIDTVAAVLGVRDVPGRDVQAGILATLSGGRTLLILDNCEHVLDACATLVAHLIQETSGLTVLTTSREPLRLTGEQIYAVSPLGLPPDNDRAEALEPEALAQFAAIQLFVDRARAVLPSFALTAEHAAAAAAVCPHLDGLPLAIELVAARSRTLTPTQLAELLADRFRVVAGHTRDRLPRHQTLRALIDWSHDLLSLGEQSLLRWLSVFAGGWDLTAAEAVSAGGGIGEGDVLDLLEALIDKSLVVAEAREGMARYRLLESIRAYAAEKLEASGEAAGVRDRHAAYLLQLAQSARRWLMGPAQAEWVRRLEAEHHNLRAALAWTLDAGDADLALRICSALSWFWFIRGHDREGWDWCIRALAAAPAAPPARRAAVLFSAAALAVQHDLSEARSMIEASVALWRISNDRRGLVNSLALLGEIARHGHDGATARQACEEALAIYAKAPNPWGQRLALSEPGWVAEDEGDHATARRLLEESLAVARATGSPIDIALQLNNLGIVASRQDEASEAAARHREALLLARELDAREAMASALEGLAGVGAAREQYERAGRLIAAAAALRAVIGSPRIAHQEEEYRRVVPAVREALGEHALAVAEAEGRALSLEEVIAYALEEPVTTWPGVGGG